VRTPRVSRYPQQHRFHVRGSGGQFITEEDTYGTPVMCLWQGLKYQIFNSRSPQLRYTNICNYNLPIITRINDFFSCFHRQTNIQSKLPFHDKLFHVSRLSYKLITHTVITTSFVSYYIQFSTSYYCLENTCKLMFEKLVPYGH